MFSMTRTLIGVGLYLVYLFAIIILFAGSNTTLYIVLLFLGVGVFLVMTFTGWLTTPPSYHRIMREGHDATATIIAMRDTGVTINNSPYVSMRLRVQPPDGPAFETSLRTPVSRLAIPSVGDEVTVKYDPRQPQNVILV